MNITIAYTGMRWSEVLGLGPKFVSRTLVDIQWKLYELNGRFYRGRPKDGSIRPADIPPFLASLLEWQIDTHPRRKCTCRNDDAPWCPGMEYVFLTPEGAHRRRSNYGARIVRPAADGWFPGREDRYGNFARPVLVDASAPWPGVPLSPWPPAAQGEPYARRPAAELPGWPPEKGSADALSARGARSCGKTARSSTTRAAPVGARGRCWHRLTCLRSLTGSHCCQA